MITLRYYPILGEGFQPRLKRGSGLLAAPTDRYQFDGIYVFRDGAIYWADRAIGRAIVHLWLENPVHGRQEVPLDWFNANVEAMAVAEVNMLIPDWERHIRPMAEAEPHKIAGRVIALTDQAA
jgi:hypothetical protein